MILRIILCIYFMKFARAADWETHISGSARPGYLTSEINTDSKPDSYMAFNPYFNSNVQVPSNPSQLLEIKQNTVCYPLKSMMKMVRGILSYLAENPSKVNYLHHLITFLKDDDENTPGVYGTNQFHAVIKRIDVDESLPHQDKAVLRELLNIDVPEPDVKTTIVFKYELPSLNQPYCKSVFMNLMEAAHNTYMQLAKHPTCQSQNDNPYDKLNTDQPGIPTGDIDVPITLEPDHKINKPYDISELIKNIIMNWSKQPNAEKPSDNYWPFILPDDVSIPNDNNNYPNPNKFIESTPKNTEVETTPAPSMPGNGVEITPNGEVSMNELMKYLLLILTQSNGNSPQHPEITEKIIGLIKSKENGNHPSYSQILQLIAKLRDNNVGDPNPKLVEIILPMLVKTETPPDPKVIKILIRLLKPDVNGVVNPKMIELIQAMLQLNKDDISKDKYQILLSLIRHDENGEVNPKLIEIISHLLRINENSAPNNKIIQFLVSFLNVNNGLNTQNIDTLLYLLKLNNNSKLPEQLYYKIIQYLLKINANKEPSSMNNFHFYYPFTYPDNSHHVDGKLLAMLIAKNPQLLHKLLPNTYATMPNQLNPNMPGVIELTYLLKHSKPFVYQPFYYVKYRLPLLTFVANVKNLLLKNPLLTSNPTKLYQDLITVSNVTEISPNLQGFSKDDILKLTMDNGALIKTKIMDDTNIDFKEQIDLVQNLNSDVQPESILEQSDHILNDQEFKYETTKLDQLWNMLHPEALDSKDHTFYNNVVKISEPAIVQAGSV